MLFEIYLCYSSTTDYIYFVCTLKIKSHKPQKIIDNSSLQNVTKPKNHDHRINGKNGSRKRFDKFDKSRTVLKN